MIRKEFAEKDGKWSELRVEIRERDGVKGLSITCASGRVLSTRLAKKEALEYWVSFFEENPTERHAMNEKWNRNFRSPKSAAKFVIDSDGPLHGLGVHSEDRADHKVYVTECCGILDKDTAEQWFPEAVPYLKWHLNDLKSTCVHQEARGETYDTHPKSYCDECDFKIGTAWLVRELPPAVVAWAEGKERKAA